MVDSELSKMKARSMSASLPAALLSLKEGLQLPNPQDGSMLQMSRKKHHFLFCDPELPVLLGDRVTETVT